MIKFIPKGEPYKDKEGVLSLETKYDVLITLDNTTYDNMEETIQKTLKGAKDIMDSWIIKT